MAINYTDLFTRLGKVIGMLRDSNSKCNTIAQSDLDAVLAEYTAEPAWAQSLSDQRTAFATALAPSVVTACKATGATTLVEQVNDEGGPISPKTQARAMEVLITAMGDDSESVEASTVSATITAGGSNTGTGAAAVTVVYTSSPSTTRQNVYDEDIILTCVKDSSSGLNYSGAEVWNYAGQAPALEWQSEWPLGSGCVGSFQTCSATVFQATVGPNKTLLLNGGFEEAFVSTVPLYWESVTGSALMSSTPTSARGDKALLVTGNGATQYKLRQKLGQSSAGVGLSPGLLQPNTFYRVGAWLRRGAAATAGVIRISLQDGSGTVLDSVSVNCTSLTTSYAFYGFTYLTGDAIAANTAFVIESTTAVPNTETVYQDELVCCQMVEAYPSGPCFCVLAGPTNYAVNDTWTLAASNDRAGLFQQEFSRMFATIMQDRLQLPYSGSPTIADSLIST